MFTFCSCPKFAKVPLHSDRYTVRSGAITGGGIGRGKSHGTTALDAVIHVFLFETHTARDKKITRNPETPAVRSFANSWFVNPKKKKNNDQFLSCSGQGTGEPV